MKIRITEGRDWFEDKVGEVFEIDEVGEGDEADRYATIYYVDPPECADYAPGRRFVSADCCEVIYGETFGNQTESDTVDHPDHYTQAKFETIEVIEEITKGYEDGFVSYCVGNALKYLSRAPFKHEEPTEDLAKAKRYLEFALDHLTKEDD